MAKDAKTRARARALYEAGESLRDVAQQVGTSFTCLKSWAKKDGWEKGKSAPKLAQKEELALEAEAERRGVTKARVLSKIAERMDAKVVVRKTDTGSFSFAPLPPGLTPDANGQVQAFGGSYYVTDDAKTQDKAIDQAIDVLGMKKEIVTVNPSDELRKLWSLAKGQA